MPHRAHSLVHCFGPEHLGLPALFYDCAGWVNREAMTAMFWVALGLFAGSAYLLFRQIHRRRWALTAIAGGGAALSLTAVAAQTWFSIIDWKIARANARCATAPNPVPFHDSVTL